MKKNILVLLSLFVSVVMVSSTVMAATVTIRPDGQGYWKKWGNKGCGSGNSEWQCVDEDPASTSDYLREGRTNDKETFTFSDSGLTDETINSVTFYYYAKWHRKLSNSCFSAMVRSSSTDYVAGTQMCVGSSWQYVSHTYNTNPAIGSAWTVSEVDALEAGMSATNPNSGGRVAQVYAVVDYEPIIVTTTTTTTTTLPTTTTTTTIPDSCNDTDGGNFPFVFGTTFGYFNENPYSSDDYCIDADSIVEYYCLGDYEQSEQQSCGTDVYGDAYCDGDWVVKDYTDYFCAWGACYSNVTPHFQENCDDYDNYGPNYCMNSSVYRDRDDYFCAGGGACYHTIVTELVEVCYSGCSDGACDASPDSCSDTDGGNVITVFGATSGYLNGNPYSNNDYCVGTGNIMEFYCDGVYETSQQQSCGTDSYGGAYCSGSLVYKDFTDHFCAAGACGSSVTPELQEDCDSYDSYGSNYCMNSSVYHDFTDYYCSGGTCTFSVIQEFVEFCDYGCVNGTCTLPPSPEETTLFVKEGYDEKNDKTLTEDGKLYLVQADDTDRIETEPSYFTSYEFDSFNFPATAAIDSVEIYVVHYEEKELPDGKLQWEAGQGTLTNLTTLITKTPVILREESNEGTEVFDVSSVIDTLEEVNNLKFVVRNNDNIEYKKTFTDYIYIIVKYFE